MVPPVKARSGHIILEGRRSFKDLARVYPEIHKRLLEMGQPLSKEMDPLLPDVLLEENLRDLRADRKPIGYNRQDPSGWRLIFPIRQDRKVEFYVAKPFRCQEVVTLTEAISAVMRRAGVRHSVEYDRIPLTPPRPGTPMPPNLAEAT